MCGYIFFLAGYFVNTEKIEANSKLWVIKRIKRVGIPFLIFSFLAATIKMIREKDSIPKYLINILLGTASPQLYYLLVLMQLILITPLLMKAIKSKNHFINSVIIAITPLYLIIIAIISIRLNIQIPQCQTIFFAWIIYYYLGITYNTKKQKINLEKYNLGACIVIVVLLLFIRSLINIYMYNIGINYFYSISQIRFLNMIYVLFIIIVMLKLENKFKNKRCLEKLGDLSFGIYFIHTYFITIYNHFIIINNYYLYLFLGIITITILSYFSIIIFKKITKNKFDKMLGF